MKELENIRKRAALVMCDYPKKQAELTQRLQKAQEDLKNAEAAQSAAENLKEYDAKADAIRRAELGVKFAKRELQKLKSTPRMDEKEYDDFVDTCNHIVISAMMDYRRAATELMDQLNSAQKKYLDIAREATETLMALDKAANVLQSKYPGRVYHFQGLPDKVVPDETAWTDYAIRYPDQDAMNLAIRSEKPGDTDQVLSAAWHAVNRAYYKPENKAVTIMQPPTVPVVRSPKEARRLGLRDYVIIEEGLECNVPEEWKDPDIQWRGSSVTELVPDLQDRNRLAYMTHDGEVYYRNNE